MADRGSRLGRAYGHSKKWINREDVLDRSQIPNRVPGDGGWVGKNPSGDWTRQTKPHHIERKGAENHPEGLGHPQKHLPVSIQKMGLQFSTKNPTGHFKVLGGVGKECAKFPDDFFGFFFNIALP